MKTLGINEKRSMSAHEKTQNPLSLSFPGRGTRVLLQTTLLAKAITRSKNIDGSLFRITA